MGISIVLSSVFCDWATGASSNTDGNIYSNSYSDINTNQSDGAYGNTNTNTNENSDSNHDAYSNGGI